MIDRIYPLCDKNYEISYGSVFRFEHARNFEFDGVVELASESDTTEIAQLIVQDEGIGGYYEVADLAAQLAERMRTNMEEAL